MREIGGHFLPYSSVDYAVVDSNDMAVAGERAESVGIDSRRGLVIRIAFKHSVVVASELALLVEFHIYAVGQLDFVARTLLIDSHDFLTRMVFLDIGRYGIGYKVCGDIPFYADFYIVPVTVSVTTNMRLKFHGLPTNID